jgi:hypothetical protein
MKTAPLDVPFAKQPSLGDSHSEGTLCTAADSW